MIRAGFICALAWIAVATIGGAVDSPVKPGESRFTEHHYAEHVIGDTPVILAAPHGGRLRPETMPDRGSGVLLSDSNTDKLARDFAEAFHRRTGRHAHVVIFHVHRVKVDANRPLDAATEGDAGAQAAWRAYHALIAEARDAVVKDHGHGLFIDLHGHGHALRRVELGYRLRHRDLKGPDDAIEKLAAKSSLRDLAGRTDKSFTELVRGATSFGGLLEANGFDAVPSPKHPHNGDAPYLNGGYCTWTYGSRDGGTISGFQLEAPGPGVRQTEADRHRFAAALADAVAVYMKTHAGVELDKR